MTALRDENALAMQFDGYRGQRATDRRR